MYWPLHGFETLGNEHPVTEHNIPEETSFLLSIVFIIVLCHHLCIKLRKNMKNLSQDIYIDITGLSNVEDICKFD